MLKREFSTTDYQEPEKVLNVHLSLNWRVLHTPIALNPQTAINAVSACCILHNFVKKKEGKLFEKGFVQYDLSLSHFKISLATSLRTKLVVHAVLSQAKLPLM